MIVKNESRVIARCLASVKPLIDTWVIVDTGSSDGTQTIIKECLKEIPGTLYERPWVDFGHNRQEALELAKDKADYLLFMDADEELVYNTPLASFPWTADYYFISVKNAEATPISYDRFLLVNNHLSWKWKDVLHEYLEVPSSATTSEKIKNMLCVSHPDGARSQDPQKHRKDIALLEKVLEKEPTHPRYTFYLAQSYYNAKEYDLAIETYQKRSQIKAGLQEEIFWSLYMIGYIQELIGKPAETFIASYNKAFSQNPNRIEPLFQLAQHFNSKGNFALGYVISKTALDLPSPRDQLYIQSWIYEYGIFCSLADSALALHKNEEALECFQKALSQKGLPLQSRSKIENIISSFLSNKNTK
jgi:glycosyltransferase involved in cell wall biosynthesis